MKKIKHWLVCCLAGSFLLSVAVLAADPPKNVIPMAKARATALKKFPGTVKSSELEQEEGNWVYSFDIRGKDKKTHEVWVDATRGWITRTRTESAREEATEQKTESDKNP